MEVLFSDERPLCFWSAEQFRLWQESNRKTSSHSRCQSVCADCLPTYQLRMRKLNRCQHPEVNFTVEDNAVVGIA